MAEFSSIVKEQFDTEVSSMYPRYFALRHSEEVSIVKYEPRDYGRMRFEEAKIRKYLQYLNINAEGVLVCIFKTDECGVWNFEEA